MRPVKSSALRAPLTAVRLQLRASAPDCSSPDILIFNLASRTGEAEDAAVGGGDRQRDVVRVRRTGGGSKERGIGDAIAKKTGETDASFSG